jgi:acetylornithine deacetylase
VAEVCAEDPWLSANPVRVEWWGGQFGSGAVPADSPVVGAVAAAHGRLHGSLPEVHGVPYGSDLRLMTARAACRRCTTGPATCGTRTRRTSGCRSTSWCSVTQTLVLLVAQVCGVR